MNKITQLIDEVATARNDYLASVEAVSEADAQRRPADDEWSVVDNTEHLFWAEQGAIYGIWKTLYAIRNGTMERQYESPHKDWPVERLIEQTWKEKEIVPVVAAPRLGGTLVFWRHSLASLQPVLEAFGRELEEEELRMLAHPHPISGAMDFGQRLAFLRFHIQRHKAQVQNILPRITAPA